MRNNSLFVFIAFAQLRNTRAVSNPPGKLLIQFEILIRYCD